MPWPRRSRPWPWELHWQSLASPSNARKTIKLIIVIIINEYLSKKQIKIQFITYPVRLSDVPVLRVLISTMAVGLKALVSKVRPCTRKWGLGLESPGLGLKGPGLGLEGPGLGLVSKSKPWPRRSSLGLEGPGLGLKAPGLGLEGPVLVSKSKPWPRRSRPWSQSSRPWPRRSSLGLEGPGLGLKAPGLGLEGPVLVSKSKPWPRRSRPRPWLHHWTDHG